jgi:hypothetical protein
MSAQPVSAARRTPVLSAGAALVALGGLFLVNPNTTHVPLCPLHALTGLSCPLCGATRATYALLHGQLGTALHDNALYVLSLPLLVLVWWRWSRALPDRPLLPRWAFWTVVATGLCFGVLRNLPVGSWLAPPA